MKKKKGSEGERNDRMTDALYMIKRSLLIYFKPTPHLDTPVALRSARAVSDDDGARLASATLARRPLR